MAELLRMPEVAAGAQSALISAWPLGAGNEFSAGQVIAIIETDKAVVDYEAEHAGVLVHPLVAEGTEVAIGEPIAVIAAPGEVVSDVDSVLAQLLGGAEIPSQGPNSPSPTHAPAPTSSPPAPTRDRPSRIFASPLARRLARESNIDLAQVAGSGPNGRIRRRDIQDHLSAGASARVAAAAPTGSPAQSTSIPVETAPEAVPHSRLRRAIATRLTQSKAESPHFYLRASAEVDRLFAVRSEINDGEDLRVSVTDMLLKAMAMAFSRVPRANVVWTDEALLHHRRVDIGLAVATDTGLVTPVVRDVEAMSVREIAQVTADLATRARNGSLRQHELEGGVTTLTNLGMFGTEDFDAIINPPQSSILAVGAARACPVVRDGALTVGSVMRFSLSVDHRPIDGAVAAEWMAAFTSLVERPTRLLLG